MAGFRSSLGPFDVELLLEKLPEEDYPLLVGGQALNLWATLFRLELPPRLQADPALFTSKDIDFVGDRSSVRKCAEAWEAEAYYPDGDHHSTPNVGTIILYAEGEQQEIDFLAGILGVNRQTLEQEAVQVAGPNRQVPIRVMHPFACLQSRLVNVYGPLGRHSESELKRLELAVAVVHQFFLALYASSPSAETTRNLLDLAEAIHKTAVGKLSRCKTPPLQAFFEEDIDLFSAIPDPEVYSIFPEMFREMRYPQMQDQLATRREKYRRFWKL